MSGGLLREYLDFPSDVEGQKVFYRKKVRTTLFKAIQKYYEAHDVVPYEERLAGKWGYALKRYLKDSHTYCFALFQKNSLVNALRLVYRDDESLGLKEGIKWAELERFLSADGGMRNDSLKVIFAKQWLESMPLKDEGFKPVDQKTLSNATLIATARYDIERKIASGALESKVDPGL